MVDVKPIRTEADYESALQRVAAEESRGRHSTSDLIADGKLAIGDGYRAKNSELGSKGLPFARAGNINEGFHFEDADRFPEGELGRVGDKVSQPGDVVFTSKGTVGRLAFVSKTTPRFVYAPQLCFWRSLDQELVDPRWLYYWMQGTDFGRQISGVKGQTDMADYVSLGDQRKMEISLPSLEEQRAIVRVLGALDDKIELNRRMSETIEEMARALFRSWFVDFDPVRAKFDGRPSGLPPALDALFPASFEASELGEIPAGWEVIPAGEAMTVHGGSTPSTKEPSYWGGEHCFATPKDLSTLQEPILASTARHLTAAGVGRIRSGLLPPGTVLLSSRAPIGYLAMTETPVAINQGIVAMVCDGPVGAGYALHWTRSSMPAIETRAGGTTFAEISKSSFREIPFLVPPESTRAAWESLATLLYDLIAANARQSRNVAAQRDTLLPRLVSGQVRVAG